MNDQTLKIFCLLILSGLITAIVIMASVPPVSRDALTHHLAVPKIYVKNGGITELPHIIVSYYPQLLDLLYCIPMMFDNDIIPKYIHFSFALLTALLIFLFLSKRLNAFYAWFGALFFLTLPVIVKLSVTVYVDLGLIFFSTAALLSLIQWRETGFKLRWLLISGISCGLAMGCKYNGLVTCFILSALIPWLYFRGYDNPGKPIRDGSAQGRRRRAEAQALGYAILFLLISLSVFSPWMVKNYIWTRNPVYPLYNAFFTSRTGPGPENASEEPSMNHFLLRKIIYKESLLETLTIPIRIFFQGEDDNPRYFDGRLNPLLFFLPLFAFYRKSDSLGDCADKRLLLLFSVLYILVVFFRQDMRIRWIGPGIPPLVILSAWGLKNILDRLGQKKGDYPFAWMKKTGPVLVLAPIAVLFLMNIVYVARLYRAIDPMPYLTGRVTRDAYIERFRPEYPALVWANRHLIGQIRILALFLGNRIYYSDHEIRGNQIFFKVLAESARDPDALTNRLKKEKITTLIIHIPAFTNWVTASFDTRERQKIHEFFQKHTQALFSKNEHGVFTLL